MLKNTPPGAAPFLTAAAKKALSFWWVFFWSLYNGWWHAWRKVNVSELSMFPQNSLHFSRKKLNCLSPSPFQLYLCSLDTCEAVWCHHGVSCKNRCIRTIFPWQVHFNSVINFTKLNNGNRKAYRIQHWAVS